MTADEMHYMDKIEKTCDEVRAENAELHHAIHAFRCVLEQMIHLNSRGKTKELHDLAEDTLNKTA